MELNPVVVFNIVVGIIIVACFVFLFRRHQATDPDGEIDIFTYGQLVLQAEQTARIIVRGIQEAWRTGEIEDDEREEDAIDQLAEMYPQLDEDTLRRIVKSAVYLLRLGAGKQVDRVMEYAPRVPETLLKNTDGSTLSGVELTHELNAPRSIG